MVLSSLGFEALPFPSLGGRGGAGEMTHKKKIKGKETKSQWHTHAAPNIHTPKQMKKARKKEKFYGVLIWNEMEFGTDSHIWHCQQKLMSGLVTLWALMPFLHLSLKNVPGKFSCAASDIVFPLLLNGLDGEIYFIPSQFHKALNNKDIFHLAFK